MAWRIDYYICRLLAELTNLLQRHVTASWALNYLFSVSKLSSQHYTTSIVALCLCRQNTARWRMSKDGPFWSPPIYESRAVKLRSNNTDGKGKQSWPKTANNNGRWTGSKSYPPQVTCQAGIGFHWTPGVILLSRLTWADGINCPTR